MNESKHHKGTCEVYWELVGLLSYANAYSKREHWCFCLSEGYLVMMEKSDDWQVKGLFYGRGPARDPTSFVASLLILRDFNRSARYYAHGWTAGGDYGSVDWIVQVLANLLRFKLASAFDSARINVGGAEMGHPPSRMTQVENIYSRLSLYMVHTCLRGHLGLSSLIRIKLLDHNLVLLCLCLIHMTIAPWYLLCEACES
jgi:hypothetical protein